MELVGLLTMMEFDLRIFELVKLNMKIEIKIE